MRILLFILISLGIGGSIWYYVTDQQLTMQQGTNAATNQARDAANMYRQNQQDIMQQIQN